MQVLLIACFVYKQYDYELNTEIHCITTSYVFCYSSKVHIIVIETLNIVFNE